MKPGRVILAVAILAAVLLIGCRIGLSDQSNSPANPSWDGLSAIAASANVQPVYRFDDLAGASAGDTLLIIGPAEPFTGIETDQVSDFVRLGGHLVLMDDYGTGNDLLAGLGSPVAIGRSPLCQGSNYYKRASFPVIDPIASEGLTANVGSLLLNHPTALQVNDTTQILAGTTGEAWLDSNDDARFNGREAFGTFPVMARFPYGQGEVTVLSDADPLSNGMLDRYDNRGLLTNILRSGIVYVDVAHGQQVPPLARLYLAVKGSLAAQVIMALLVLAVVCLALAGIRVFAGPWPGVEPAGPGSDARERLLARLKRLPLTGHELRELKKKL